MTDHLLIDGWNVCWKIPEIAADIPQRSREARQKFNRLVKNCLAEKKVVYQIVYDGQPDIVPGESVKNPNIRFSKNPEKADQLIISFLRKQRVPRQWTVITSDRELANKAKSLEAGILSSEDFITRLRRHKTSSNDPTGKDEVFLSPQEVEFWLQKFKDK
jgi:predicted RNA-binding protein with PIN domain